MHTYDSVFSHVHAHNLHPRKQICIRVQKKKKKKKKKSSQMCFLKTSFTCPKVHPGSKFSPRVYFCTRVQIVQLNPVLERSVAQTTGVG